VARTTRAFGLAGLAAVAVMAAAAGPSRAAFELITNGNFETGTFAGWTTHNLAGGSGDFFIDTPGTTTPFSGQPTQGNPMGGNFYAVSDQGGPGTHALIQSFVVPLGTTSLTLSFDMFVNDFDGGPIVGPQGLDHVGPANQHARVDILTAAATPFSTAAADVVSNHYLSVDPGADPNPYTSYSINLAGLTPGGTYQIRFAEVDNQLFLSQGVDNVSILAEAEAVPEPASAALLGLGAVGMIAGAIRRRRQPQAA
jgi:hypothetical protein